MSSNQEPGRKIKQNDTVNDIASQIRNLIEQGNARRLVIRTATGREVIDLSLTGAVLIGGLFVFLVPGGLFLTLVGVVIAIFARIRIEVLRVLNDDDEVVELRREE